MNKNMSAQMVLAVRNIDRVSVYLRRRQKAGAGWHYACVCSRDAASGAFTDFEPFRSANEAEVKESIAALENLETQNQAINPLEIFLTGPDHQMGAADGATWKTLLLCSYADFFRFSLEQELKFAKYLGTILAGPVDFRELRLCIENLLALDRPEAAIPFLDRNSAVLAATRPTEGSGAAHKGDAGHTLRLVADLEERIGRLAQSAAALERSQLIAPNQHKLARLIFLYEKLEDWAKTMQCLQLYEASFPAGPRMMELKKKLTQTSRD